MSAADREGAGRGSPEGGSLTRTVALVDAAVAALITCGAAALSFAMPNLIVEGGLPSAQQFITLSPVFFPRLAFGVLTMLGMIYLVGALRRIPLARQPTPVEGTSKFLRVVTIFLFSLLYPILLPWLGYGFATLLVVGGVTLFLGNRLWWQVLPFAVLAPVVIRFTFERMLGISLPRASIEGLSAAEDAVMKLLSGVLLTG